MFPAYLSCVIITSVSAFVSLGFSIAALRTKDKAGKLNARYALSRSLALVVLSLVPWLYNSPIWLVAVAITMIVTQIADGAVGAISNDVPKTLGPLGIAVLNAVALMGLIAVCF